MAKVTLKGNEIHTNGELPKVGTEAPDFKGVKSDLSELSLSDLKGKKVLGGRAGGMPQMVFEYILKKHGIDPKTDLTIDQSISFGLTAAAFT